MGRFLPVAVALPGLAVFAPALGGYFISDDFGWVAEFYRFDLRQIPRLFVGDWSLGIWGANLNEYRPLWGLSFIVDLRLWGPNPLALHMTSLGLHAIAAALVWRLTLEVTASWRAAVLGLAFFIAAPVHEQTVSWIAARGHILVTIFSLTSLLLFRRCYWLSLGATLAAFATLELAVALPGLLLLRDLADGRRYTRAQLRNLARLHAPFWCLLLAYLTWRVLIFGQVSPPGSAEPVSGVAAGLVGLVEWVHSPLADRATREIGRVVSSTVDVWTSATSGGDSPWPIVLLATGALVLLAAWPLWVMRGDERWRYARQLACFGIGWPVLSTLPLLGQHDQRHFYLASVGLALALGLAADRLIDFRCVRGLMAAGLVLGLLVGHTLLLASGIAAFGENGEQSWQLRRELQTALDRTADDGGTLVVLPEMPTERWFWEYGLPFAALTPFTDRTSVSNLIPSPQAYCCTDWQAAFGPMLARLNEDAQEPVYVVAWDAGQDAFVTRVLSHAQFRQSAYMRLLSLAAGAS